MLINYCAVVGADLPEANPPNEEMLFGNIVEELYRKSHHPEATNLEFLEPYDPSVPHGSLYSTVYSSFCNFLVTFWGYSADLGNIIAIVYIKLCFNLQV